MTEYQTENVPGHLNSSIVHTTAKPYALAMFSFARVTDTKSHSGDGTAALIFKSQVILTWQDHTAQVSRCCSDPEVLTFVYRNLKVSNLNHQSFCHTQIYISVALCIKYACAFAFKHFLREMTC